MPGANSSSAELVIDPSAAPEIRKHPRPTAVERRRRPLTIFFGCCLGALLLGVGSRWPAQGVAQQCFFLLGVSLATIGTLGRVWSNLYISGYKTRTLIKTGPYSLCRNPLYFFSAIGAIGIGLCSETLTVPLVLGLFFAVYYPMIIAHEERRLRETHHDDFEEYRRTVPAFWPRLSSFQEPDTYVMVPRVVRKNIVDAFWFVALAGCVHVVSNLHDTPLLPEIFHVW